MKLSILYKKFGKEKRWVNWRYVTKDGKITKVPVGANGALAKSNDDSTWMNYDKAESLSENVGIMATPDRRTLMVDFDNCLDANGMISGENVERFVTSSKTYVEFSPSGNGLHLFFTLSEPLTLSASKHNVNEKEKVECYTHGRYFTVTNKPYLKPRKVRDITPEEAIGLLSLVGYPWSQPSTVVPQTPEQMKASHMKIYTPELIAKMFRSKNGDKVRALYDGDTSAYEGDESSADMALCAHLAFWTRKDASLMEEIWLASPLGQRRKTQGRKDYRDRTIATAIRNCTEVYDPVPEQSYDEAFPFSKVDFLTQMKGKNPVVAVCTENIVRILSHHSSFKNRIRMETFKNRIEIKNKNAWKSFEDSDIILIQSEIATVFPPFRTIPKHMVADAILLVASGHTHDSANEYLKSLKWDKVSRLDSWLTQTYGTPDDAYHRAVGSNWMKGLVSRLISPGCKFDHVLVLEGPQGSRKSTSLHVLGGEWHVETTASTDNKDFFMQFSSKAIIEFSEGETLSRTEVKRLKAIITMQFDKYRPPYGRYSMEFPRRCVFAMTTNESEYLKDDTGNRRWLPVTLVRESADIEWLRENRDQLYAEAYHRVSVLKEPIHEFPMKEMLEEQRKRKTEDPNADLVADWYWKELSIGDRVWGITVTQVYKVMSGGYIHRAMTKSEQMNIASILRDKLSLERRQVMTGGSRVWRWYRKEGEPDPMEGEDVSIMDQLKNW